MNLTLARPSVGLIAIVALAGCAGSNARPAGTAASQKSYAQALSICRQRHSGRTNQRRRLDPTDAHVAACLRRFGWHPDGTPILESVIPAEGPAR